MEIVSSYQLLPYSLCNSSITHDAFRNHNCSAATFTPCIALNFPHDQLKEKKGGLSRLLILWEVGQNSLFFLAPEGRIGHNDAYPILIADLPQSKSQCVLGVDLRIFHAMEQEIHLAKEIGQWFRLYAEKSP